MIEVIKNYKQDEDVWEYQLGDFIKGEIYRTFDRAFGNSVYIAVFNGKRLKKTFVSFDYAEEFLFNVMTYQMTGALHAIQVRGERNGNETV